MNNDPAQRHVEEAEFTQRMTTTVRSLGMVLHPLREIAEPVERILTWANSHHVSVLGLKGEIARLSCRAVAVSEDQMAERADLLVALGGDGTVLRAMRLGAPTRCPY